VLADGASVSLAGNLMRVAEIEFAFCFGQRLAPRASGYTTPEVLDAVSTMHPSIEIPDSRFENFVTAGAPQLIADLACANLFVLGPGQSDWRDFDYIDAAIQIKQNDAAVDPGFGRNVLGDPRVALTWLVNELSRLGIACEPGQFVTTGTCRVPVTVRPNDRIHADFGVLGQVSCSFSE
jgi:2-keto-4-pentenoate hydratase